MSGIFENINEKKNEINEILTNEKYKENTILSYWFSIKRISKLLNNDYNIDDINLYDDLINVINSIDKMTSRKTTFNNMIKIFQTYNLIINNETLNKLIKKLLIAFNKFAKKLMIIEYLKHQHKKN